ncbi:MAG: TetR/AcrR family transcriptional regulator [Lachnospiraceae bacterium]
MITSKETILNTSRQLIKEQGWAAINIRSVAAACGVSVGSIYNYFNSKSDLIAATIESVWCDIFHFQKQGADFVNFSDCVQWIFNCMKKGGEKYPGFFTLHSMSFLGEDRVNGHQLMMQSWEHIQNELYTILINDKNIRSDAFNEILTPQKFVDIIFSLIISALIRQNYDSSAILEMIQRMIY